MTTIAVVVLDTVRFDSFYRAFEWLDGRHFSRAYSTSHWTVPAHASLFTGEYASSAGVHGHSPTLDAASPTLAERFRAAGYRTRAWSANAQLNQYDGWERGFEEFVTTANLGRTDERIFDWAALIDATTPGLSRYLSGLRGCLSREVDTLRSLRYGYDLVRTPEYDGGAAAVRSRLADTEFDGDELLFVNLMDAHTPYRPPPGESDSVTVVVADALADAVEDPERIRAAYRSSVEYLADQYREIFTTLRDEFDYVVTLSDHGELLGERGLWNHSISLQPELVQIPLVVSGDAVEDGVSHEPVNLLDVHRTVAALGDVPVESGGRPLLDDLAPRELLFESHGLLPFHSAQFDRKGLSRSTFERWQTPLYGHVTTDGAYCYERRPGDVRCLGVTDRSAAETRLETLIEEHLAPVDTDDHVDVSAEVKARLQDLGYA